MTHDIDITHGVPGQARGLSPPGERTQLLPGQFPPKTAVNCSIGKHTFLIA
jgi:hypothetical protein